MFTPLEVQLQAGEVREVQIDARECGTCSVDLTILLGGRPAANAQVSLLGDGGRKSLELGKTNREGRLETSAPLGSGLGVSLWTADRVQLKHPTARLDLTLDAKIVETIRFDTANVVLVLPQSLVLPAKCSLSFVLTPTGGVATGSTWRSLNLADGVTQDSGVTANESGRRLQFSDLIAGDWQFVFDVSDAADPVERVQLTANSWETHRKTMYSATGAFIVTSGQTVTVELR